MKKIVFWGFTSLLLWILVGCGGKSASVDIEIYGPPHNTNIYNDIISQTHFIVVSVLGDGAVLKQQQTAVTPGQPATIKVPDIPFGENRQIFVEFSKTGNPDIPNDIVAKGYSVPFDVLNSDVNTTLYIYITPVDRFIEPAAKFANDVQATGPAKVSNPVPPMFGAKAVVLENGKVLITGGATVKASNWSDALNPSAITGVTNAAFIYDPNTNQFLPTTVPMIMPRAFHSMTTLPSGLVLICGGVTYVKNQVQITDTCEYYDPKENSFFGIVNNSLPKMASPRAYHRAVLYTKGITSVVFTGGISTLDGAPPKFVWTMFHPSPRDPKSQGIIAIGGAPAVNRWNHDAILVNNFMNQPMDALLLIGGENKNNVLDTVDVIDLACSRANPRNGSMCVNKTQNGASIGPIKIAGGARTMAKAIFDPTAQIVYVAGGFSKKDYSTAQNNISLLNVRSGTFYTTVLPIPNGAPISAMGGTWFFDPVKQSPVILFAGGVNASGPTDKAFKIIYNSSNGGISPQVVSIGSCIPTTVFMDDVITLPNNKAMLIGGITGSFTPNNQPYVYSF